MSIFGKLDAANIPTNPFWVEAGEYEAEVTEAKYQVNKKEKDTRQLVIKYTIDEDESEFNGYQVAQFFNLVDPEMTVEDLELLPLEDRKAIRRNNAALKKTLCGNNQGQKGLGVDSNDLNDSDWDPGVLVGLKVNIGVRNYGSTNEGVSVQWVSLRD